MGIVNVDGQEVHFDDDWSNGIFTNQSLKDYTGLHGVVIYASSFYWETPDSNPWPADAANITFVKCNLDNLILPPNSTLIQCRHNRIKLQDDGFDWYIDENNQPLERV